MSIASVARLALRMDPAVCVGLGERVCHEPRAASVPEWQRRTLSRCGVDANRSRSRAHTKQRVATPLSPRVASERSIHLSCTFHRSRPAPLAKMRYPKLIGASFCPRRAPSTARPKSVKTLRWYHPPELEVPASKGLAHSFKSLSPEKNPQNHPPVEWEGRRRAAGLVSGPFPSARARHPGAQTERGMCAPATSAGRALTRRSSRRTSSRAGSGRRSLPQPHDALRVVERDGRARP